MGIKASRKEGLLCYQQLSAIFDDLQIGVFTVDSDRRITSFNRAAELLTGYHEKDVLGRYCYQIFRNDLCYGECKFHEAVEAEQKSLRFDVEIKDRYNEKRVITKIVMPLYDMTRQVIGCIEIFQDYSVFEELINRIRYNERQLKIILDNVNIGIFTVTRGGHITFFNTMAESISGYDRKEVLGKLCSIILDEDFKKGASLLKDSITDGRPRSNKKGLLTTKDGRVIPIQANYMALRNEQGRIVGGLATIQDLSLIYQLNRAIRNRYTFADMIGKEPAMQKIFEIIPVVADSDATVLIEGRTGTGKDLLAKVIHNVSKRANKPFVKVNCAALPDNLLESEMFGYVKGAFTGADRNKPGRFQEADGGTIFLDEIGDLPLSLQAKLLRVLEDREFYPLGSRKTTKVDVRIIAATNQGLEKLVKENGFREDLFYRLNVIRLELPPLKERKGDIPLLIEHIMKRFSGLREEIRARKISEEAMEILLNYDYPGNIRELENILEHALILSQDETIERKHLPLFLQKRFSSNRSTKELVDDLTPNRHSSEKDRILETLKQHNWHRGKTAQELNIDRTTLWRKMKKYNLS
nr:PAS domain S-box protein [Desulfobacterales bacterium]